MAVGRALTTVAAMKKLAWWKWLGLAGLVGVAVTGAAVARQERERRAYTPEEIRSRLRERHAEAEQRASTP